MNQKKQIPVVTFLPDGQVVEIRKEMSVLELALKNKVNVDNSCAGSGSCGTCRVLVLSPEKMPQRNDVEHAMAEDRGFQVNERLACQIEPIDGMIIEVQSAENKKIKGE